ncbi:uncharacterized protein LOC122030540 [Zingiber officinale]|uniref:uncharacterized protein LOC122030540 n=1 Tax=Zingiber officinale TaxID=94328 RepID=UPI001C4B09D3|nr:uncharacterized protein LOC122030540 [Zingiber officinale]
MLRMLRPEIALNVSNGTHQPLTGEELVSRALVAEHYLNSIKSQQALLKPVKLEDKTVGNQRAHSSDQNWKGKGNKRKQWNSGGSHEGGPANKQTKFPPCPKCGRVHLGTCLLGTTGCYSCGQEGHLAKACPNKFKAPQQQSVQYGGRPTQLHHMITSLEGPYLSQGRLEAPPVQTDATVFSLTKEEAASASVVVTDKR